MDFGRRWAHRVIMLGWFIGIVYVLLFLTLVLNVLDVQRSRRRTSAIRLPSLSVLIPARNEDEHLRRLIPQLLAQDYPQYEIILYDDGSDDETQVVLAKHADPRLRVLRGRGVPAGWVGKVHALYQATREASGDLYLFLDADLSIRDSDTLERLVSNYLAIPAPAVMTGLTRLRGAGLLLVSLVPNAVLTTLPWPLLRRIHLPGAGALNGQCWMITRDLYHRFEPHREFPSEVLEDVRIGRHLLAQGIVPHLVDVRDDIEVTMYDTFSGAWRGFRKNAYLLMSGRPLLFAGLSVFFATVFIGGPLLHPAYLFGLYLLKTATDRIARMPWWVSVLAPVSFVLAVILQWDSAVHHWLDRVHWKGRRV